MHPNGQLPAYEWNFSDVNPPVHAWAVWRVYKIADKKGERDLIFLEKAFQKLLLNFTWWVNRKDIEGRHVFGGGFLGLDNIGVFDRSRPLPDGGHLNQADGTAWMASYCLLMLSMSLELALTRPAYEDIASKFFEHFVSISDAINALGGDGLWDEEDGFYYDQLIIDHQNPIPLKVRSLVGLLPLIAVTVLDQKVINALPGFKKRMMWFIKNRPELAKYVSYGIRGKGEAGDQKLRLLAIPSKERLRRCVQRLVDEGEFLSDFGIRSLSKIHEKHPFNFDHGGEYNEVAYVPGDSDSWMFGGNSNWRGPSGSPSTSSSSRRSSATTTSTATTSPSRPPPAPATCSPSTRSPTSFPSVSSTSSKPARTATAPASAMPNATATTPPGRTSSSSTSTSTPRPARASVPATRPAGPPSSSASSASAPRSSKTTTKKHKGGRQPTNTSMEGCVPWLPRGGMRANIDELLSPSPLADKTSRL